MDPIGPGNHDRAWNDPPKFAYNSAGVSGSSNPSGRRRLLNKRVPVPIGPQTGTSPLPPPLKPGDGPPIGSPPLMAPPLGPPPMSKPPTSMPSSDKTILTPKSGACPSVENFNSQDILEKVETAFENSLKRVSEHIKDNLHDEITKRFKVMKTMWIEGKLNDVVQSRMLTLTKALDEGNFDEAWTIHQGLIVDFTSICSPWMVGIKSLVIELRNQARDASDVATDDPKPTEEDRQPLVPMTAPLDISNIKISNTNEDTSDDNQIK